MPYMYFSRRWPLVKWDTTVEINFQPANFICYDKEGNEYGKVILNKGTGLFDAYIKDEIFEKDLSAGSAKSDIILQANNDNIDLLMTRDY